MVQLLIVIVAATALIAISLRANARLHDAARLPMQWSLTGKVNWTAPRALALALTPALAICVLCAMAVAAHVMTPRPGQEGLETPILLLMSVTFIAVHLLHLWLIGRSVRS